MAIETIKRKKQTMYRAIFCKDRQRISRCFDRKYDAQQWLDEQQERSRFGFKKGLTFKEAALYWLNNHSLNRKAPGGYLLDKDLIEKSFIPLYGNLPLEEFSPRHVEDYIALLRGKNRKNSTINRHFNVLRAILNHYVKQRYLSYNVVSMVGLLPEEQPQTSYLSFEEVVRFLTYTNKKYQGNKRWVYRLYLVAINVGLRAGEIYGLMRDSVNLESGTITVQRTYCRRTKQVRNSTKGGKPRTVAINCKLYPELKAQIDEMDKDQVLVFCNSKGNVLNHQDFKRDYFFKDLEETGINHKIRYHDMRHTFGSHYAMKGGYITELQQFMGHSTSKTTERYMKLSPDHLAKRIELVAIDGGKSEITSFQEAL